MPTTGDEQATPLVMLEGRLGAVAPPPAEPNSPMLTFCYCTCGSTPAPAPESLAPAY